MAARCSFTSLTAQSTITHDSSMISAKLTLKEQYPISNDKDIEVKLVEVKPAATYNKEEIGVLTWDLELSAGETRTFVVTYSVKYPKEQTISW